MTNLSAYVYYRFSPIGGNGNGSPLQEMSVTVTGEYNGTWYHFSRTWNNNAYFKKYSKELERLLSLSTPNMEYLKEENLIPLTQDECEFVMKEVY
jgi:hypothetical protein